MDSLTHIVLGACIGEVFIGKKAGRRSLFLGAVAQKACPILILWPRSLPAPTQDLIAHRGITHSLLFVLLVTPLLAWLADKWRRPHDIAFSTWLWFFAVELLTHLSLDIFNAYGTGLLEPFSHQRFCVHAMFVADPLFSILPGIVTVALVFMRRDFMRKTVGDNCHWLVHFLFGHQCVQ